MKQETFEIDNDGQEDQLRAWRICQAWRKILGIKLNQDRVTEHLRSINELFSAPTPLADKALVQTSKVIVLAELKKEPGGNRAQKGGTHGTENNASTVMKRTRKSM